MIIKQFLVKFLALIFLTFPFKKSSYDIWYLKQTLIDDMESIGDV